MAKRPPSSCTIGRSSGGMTGRTSSTIHDGAVLDLRKASTTRRRLIAFWRRWPLVDFNSSRRRSASLARSIWLSSSRTAAAPMPALNTLPYRSTYSRYWVSVRRSRTFSASSSSRCLTMSARSVSSSVRPVSWAPARLPSSSVRQPAISAPVASSMSVRRWANWAVSSSSRSPARRCTSIATSSSRAVPLVTTVCVSTPSVMAMLATALWPLPSWIRSSRSRADSRSAARRVSRSVSSVARSSTSRAWRAVMRCWSSSSSPLSPESTFSVRLTTRSSVSGSSLATRSARAFSSMEVTM